VPENRIPHRFSSEIMAGDRLYIATKKGANPQGGNGIASRMYNSPSPLPETPDFSILRTFTL
jgi:hypothetical protein